MRGMCPTIRLLFVYIFTEIMYCGVHNKFLKFQKVNIYLLKDKDTENINNKMTSIYKELIDQVHYLPCIRTLVDQVLC